MAFVGMRHIVAARLKEHTEGQEPVYEGGRVIGKAIRGNLTITRNNNPLYADDVIAEDDNGITAMSLEMGMDDMSEEDRAFAIGTEENKQGEVTEYLDSDASAPYMGVGYIRVRRKSSQTTYQGVWYYKGTFSEESEESQTKGESIEWKTPTIKARMAAVAINDSGKRYFRTKANFPNEAKAIEWLEKKANISAEPVKAKGDSRAVAKEEVTASK